MALQVKRSRRCRSPGHSVKMQLGRVRRRFCNMCRFVVVCSTINSGSRHRIMSASWPPGREAPGVSTRIQLNKCASHLTNYLWGAYINDSFPFFRSPRIKTQIYYSPHYRGPPKRHFGKPPNRGLFKWYGVWAPSDCLNCRPAGCQSEALEEECRVWGLPHHMGYSLNSLNRGSYRGLYRGV